MIALGLWERWRGASLPNAVFWGSIILLLFVACYKAWLNENDTAEYYQEKFTPKLEISFEQTPPFVECTHYGYWHRTHERTYYRLIRVGVKNISGTDLYSVQVMLEGFSWNYRSFDAIPFRLKDSQWKPFQLSCHLNPDQTRYFDIAMVADHETPTSPHGLILCHGGVPEVSDSIGMMERHHLTIMATSHGAQPARRRFVLYVDEERHWPHMEPDQEL